MTLPDDLLELPAAEAARLIALVQIESVLNARDRLGGPDEPEALHDLRVGLRRLRTSLRLYRPQLRGSVDGRSRRRLRRITDATRESRDLEVHIAWARSQMVDMMPWQRTGVFWLLDRMERRRRKADASLERVLERRFDRTIERLEPRLRRYRTTIHLDPSHPPRRAAAVVGKRVQQAAAALGVLLARVRSIRGVEEAHRARIAAKRLRYVLEPTVAQVDASAPIIERLKILQDDLGDLRDTQVFIAELDQAVRKAPAVARPGVLALVGRLRERGLTTFRRVSTEWLEGAAEPFIREAMELGRAIAARRQPGVEIERKYLLRGLPDAVQGATAHEIRQGYLPGTRLVERLREVRTNGSAAWYRTVKSGAGLWRIELEEETTREVFDRIWPLTAGHRVQKRRYPVRENGATWEIDQFTDRDLVLAEIELPSPGTEVTVPEWLAPLVVREVTSEAEYTNARLAR
ncbi:MAG TPA: CHAD domain-containing protein [Gemmatimonadales bacterium]|jgi:CHAD domain-containing protein/CYTH domain-containing protein